MYALIYRPAEQQNLFSCCFSQFNITWTLAFSPNALTVTWMLGFPAHFNAGSIISSFSSVTYTFIPNTIPRSSD